jgi:hypothetical protein
MRTESGLLDAREAMLDRAGGGDEGPFEAILTRWIARPLTVILLSSPVLPSAALTVLGAILGVVGAGMLTLGRPGAAVLGAAVQILGAIVHRTAAEVSWLRDQGRSHALEAGANLVVFLATLAALGAPELRSDLPGRVRAAWFVGGIGVGGAVLGCILAAIVLRRGADARDAASRLARWLAMRVNHRDVAYLLLLVTVGAAIEPALDLGRAAYYVVAALGAIPALLLAAAAVSRPPAS